jgi:hypothetical protein
MPEPELCFIVNFLFGDGDGAALAERIDRRVSSLPGLDGLRLVGDRVRSLTAA